MPGATKCQILHYQCGKLRPPSKHAIVKKKGYPVSDAALVVVDVREIMIIRAEAYIFNAFFRLSPVPSRKCESFSRM